MNTRSFATTLLTFVALAFASTALGKDAAKTYLAHNLWYEKPNNVSTIGYKRGTRIPAGTEVTNVKVSDGRKASVSFTVPEWELDITVRIDGHQKDKLTAQDVKDRLITDKDFDALTKDFTDQEKTCVKNGYIATGISKEAALAAYGYPPKHRTPTTKMPTWVYWTSRFVTRTVNFDEDGKATNGIGNQ